MRTCASLAWALSSWSITTAFLPNTVRLSSYRPPTKVFAAPATDVEAAASKMRASQLQAELKAMGVSTVGMLEKSELVTAYVAAVAEGKTASSAPAAETPAPASAPAPEGKSRRDEPAADADPAATASKMRISQLQAELKSMGVSTKGMLEKSELVAAYAQAIRDGKTAGSGGDDDDDDDVFDPDVKELKTTKMPRAGDPGDGAIPNAGNPFGGGGGSPFGGGGSPFGGMGGGGPGGGMNMGDIFNMMGGMGGGGGMPNMGGMGGMGGIQDLLQKAMGDPKLMATIQKAAGNPKVMAAVQDVMQNGPGAVNKYANDPEVKSILDQLKGIL